MTKKTKLWWENLSLDQKTSFIKKIEEKKAAAYLGLELNWSKARIFKVKKVKMLIPYSEKLKEYYFFNAKDKARADMLQ